MNKNIEIPKKIFNFANKYKELIDSSNFKALYERAEKEIPVAELTEMLLSANINPLKYLSYIPEDFLFYEYPEAANVANITSVTLNKNICEYIDEHAFTGSNITELNFQGLGLISIESQAFYSSKLTKITLPDTLERIEMSAFAYCDHLTDIWYEGTVEDWKGIQKAPMWRDGTSNLKIHTMRDHRVITYK